ncbi:MAG: hypothetical protein OXT49_11675 [Gammaproteobacteria bacterium]|nr:hypothetical protein [Gammaproteobacteria bacterium]
MRKALVMIQAQQFSDIQLAELEALIRNTYRQHVSSEKLMVVWSELAAGQAYTNYAPSQTSIVSAECENGFPQEKRVAYLTELAREWSQITGQHLDSLMLALVDADQFKIIADSTLRRLSFVGRIKFGLHVAKNLLHSKLNNTPLRFSPDL